MTEHATSTKKFLAAGGVALGLAGFGLFVGMGTAAADGTKPDSGSYDKAFELRDATQSGLNGSYGPHGGDMGTFDGLINILDGDGFQADKP